MSEQVVRVPKYEVMMPTRMTLFWRRFFPWQLVRFVVINLRMLRMIRLSHPHRIPPGKRTSG